MEKFLRLILIMVLGGLFIGTPSSIAKEDQNPWPAVKPMKKNFHLVDHKEMGAKMEIVGEDGRPLYLLECYINAYDHEDPDFAYSGDLECRLTPSKKEDIFSQTLLTGYRNAVDWDSRARFFVREFEGKQAEDIDYGKVRRFRLRGMALTIGVKKFKGKPGSRIENKHWESDHKGFAELYRYNTDETHIPWNRGRIEELDLEVDVIPDPKAKLKIAAPSEKVYSSWPDIKPIKQGFHLVAQKEPGAKLEITGVDGTPLYFLECYLNAYNHEDPDFNYSGAFECQLSVFVNGNKRGALLRENPYATKDWDSRGRFLFEELTGKCAEYPDYGKLRTFRLRGMKLSLEVKKFKINPAASAKDAPENVDIFENLDFEVNITSDPKALSEIAEPTKYLEPPPAHPEDPNDSSLDCDTIRYKEHY